MCLAQRRSSHEAQHYIFNSCLGPGDVGVIGSNEIHNAKNVGATMARYFIVNIGRDDV